MLGSLVRKALRRVYHHTDRILIAELSGNPVTTVVVVYSPTNVAPSEEMEKFYEDLATAVYDVPAHNFLAILGDFNARLGPEDVPFSYHDSTNCNGTHLPALLKEHQVLATHTMYRKRTAIDLLRPSHRYCTSAGLHTCQVKVEELHLECYTFCSVGSDHRVVSMKVRLSLRVPKPSPKIWHDWKAFAADPDL